MRVAPVCHRAPCAALVAPAIAGRATRRDDAWLFRAGVEPAHADALRAAAPAWPAELIGHFRDGTIAAHLPEL